MLVSKKTLMHLAFQFLTSQNILLLIFLFPSHLITRKPISQQAIQTQVSNQDRFDIQTTTATSFLVVPTVGIKPLLNCPVRQNEAILPEVYLHEVLRNSLWGISPKAKKKRG